MVLVAHSINILFLSQTFCLLIYKAVVFLNSWVSFISTTRRPAKPRRKYH